MGDEYSRMWAEKREEEERLRQMPLFNLLFLALNDQEMQKKISYLNLETESMEFFMLNSEQYTVNLSMNGITSDISCVFYKRLPKENWVMNVDPMKCTEEQMTWTSSKSKIIYAPEKQTFCYRETLEISAAEFNLKRIWIQQTDKALLAVTDYIHFLFRPKRVFVRLAVDQFPKFRDLPVWLYNHKLTQIVVNSSGTPVILSHEDYEFLLDQGTSDKLLTFYMVNPRPPFRYDDKLPVSRLSITAMEPWINASNLMNSNLEAVSLSGCHLPADEVRILINRFKDGHFPRLRFLDLMFPDYVSESKLQKRIMRGWETLPKDVNRRGRYFEQFSSDCNINYDCSDFQDIQSSNGLLASMGVEHAKFMMVVWHDRFPCQTGNCKHPSSCRCSVQDI